MQSQVQGAWTGWQGDTIVQLTNGSIWRQTQYLYQYRYRYRPKVIIDGNMMYGDGMTRAVRVQRTPDLVQRPMIKASLSPATGL